MKGIAVLLITAVVAVIADQQCPTDWTQELLLRHEDCDKFYKCAYGEPVTQYCPAGLHFNLETWQCDWVENVNCDDRNDPINPKPTTTERLPETTTSAPVTQTPGIIVTTERLPKPTTSAPVTQTPGIIVTTERLPKPTTSAPVTQTPGIIVTTERLPKPTTSAPVTQTPGIIVTTPPATKPPVSTAAPTTEPAVESEWLQNGCPVDPHVHWLLPHEYDCNLFYYCVWGGKVLRECSATLHFNREKQVCDWPWDANCPVSSNKHLEGRKALLNSVV